MVDKAVTKYLARQTEPDAGVATAIPGEFGHVLIVPAYAEGDALFSMLGSVPAGPGGDVLIVLVLNARADSSEEAHRANAAVRERLEREFPASSELSGEAGPPVLSYP
ncbi:MAG: hypothetical protein ACM369_05890, partial [Acidobacteriota bacterium]